VLLIKLALFKLSEAQFRSMAKMKRLQPRLKRSRNATATTSRNTTPR
jgi:membrane protein insertase Oxa1/YidC/SpoIIIJ